MRKSRGPRTERWGTPDLITEVSRGLTRGFFVRHNF